MNEAIQVLYLCTCKPAEQTFTIVARRPDEDIAAFMKRVEQGLANNHALKSPQCRARKTTYVKIPIAGENQPIGAAVPPKGAA